MSAWLDDLRTRLPRHASLIEDLIAICEGDDRIEVLELMDQGAGAARRAVGVDAPKSPMCDYVTGWLRDLDRGLGVH